MAKSTQINASCGVEIARMVGLSDALDEGAATIKAVADQLAARHVDTGAYLSKLAIEKIPGKKGVIDRAVVDTDPQSHIIEAGHMASNGRWVPGQFILTTAAIIASK